MTMPYFAGLNRKLLAEASEGFPMMISYADVLRSPGSWSRELLPRLEAGEWPSVMLDSGAFTEFTTGKKIPLEGFVSFCQLYGHLFDTIITMDDIAGSLETTWKNTKVLLDAGVDVVPVFHGGGVEPWEVLHHYCQRFDRVALGFARIKNTINKDQGNGLTPDQWLAQALDICEAYGVDVHGLGMTRYALKKGHTRLTTSDSSTWIAEGCKLRSRSTNPKDSDRLGDGEAAALIQGLTNTELMTFTLWSYRGTGADANVRELVTESRGQSKSVFVRYNTAELGHALELIESRRAA